MNKQLEQEIYGHIKSMLEVSFEYVNWNESEISHIYIFCSSEESIFFDFFYSTDTTLIEKHRINDFLQNKCDTSEARQSAALDVGMNDLKEIISIFKSNNEDVPCQITVIYDISKKNMSTDFLYKSRLLETNLMEEDLLDEWIKKLALC